MTRTERDSTMQSLVDIAFYTPHTSLSSETVASPPGLSKSGMKRCLGQGGSREKRRRPLPFVPDDFDGATEMPFYPIVALPMRRGQVELYTPSISFVPVGGSDDEIVFADDFTKPGLPLIPSSQDLFSSISPGGTVTYGMVLAPRFRSSRLHKCQVFV